jgi:hypothetical protein
MLSIKQLGFAKWRRSQHKRVQCCYWLTEFKFPVTVQLTFREKYGRDPRNKRTVVTGTSICWNVVSSSDTGQAVDRE